MVACEQCERGTNVTLLELADEVGISAESLLALRLGDVAALACAADAPSAARWTDSVRAALLGSTTSLQSVSRALAVSPRTLQRRLAEERATWRSVVDGFRQERAAELLRRGSTAEHVALEIGFSSSRALRRALRRWDRGEVGTSSPDVGAFGPPDPCAALTMSKGDV
jgi:AraC-like DNA-binding protein